MHVLKIKSNKDDSMIDESQIYDPNQYHKAKK